MLTLEQAKEILKLSKEYIISDSNSTRAEKYLNSNDLEGFERICRGNNIRLNVNNIPYTLTDGPAEIWHDNFQLREISNYLNGELYGVFESYNENCELTYRCNYNNGKLHGPYESYYSNGQPYVKYEYDSNVE